MESSSHYKSLIDTKYGEIEDQKEVINGISAELKLELNISIVEQGTDNTNEVPETNEPMEAVVLDEDWFNNHRTELEAKGWYVDESKGRPIYCCTLDDGTVIKYDPKNSKMTTEKKNKKGKVVKTEHNVKLTLYGDISDVTEVVTALKVSSANGKETNLPDTSTSNKLVISYLDSAEHLDDRTQYYVNDITLFGDKLTGDLGNNNKVSNTLMGFSQGGVQACLMMSNPDIAKNFDKLTLLDVSPSNGSESRALYNAGTLKGKTVEIIQTYGNRYNDRYGAEDYYTSQKGGPHLDKLLEAGANVIISVPETDKDQIGKVTGLVEYARNLQSKYPNSLTINEFEIDDATAGLYNHNSGNWAHEAARTHQNKKYPGASTLADLYFGGII